MARGIGRRALLLAALLAALGLSLSARAAATVLYDGTVEGQKLDDQGYFSYLTSPLPPAAASTAYAEQGTALLTLAAPADYAGYFTPPGKLPRLDSSAGYTLTFTAQVLDEAHSSVARAGFSLLVLGADDKDIELGFWTDEVWAQNDGVNDPTPGAGLFTHGEGAAFDTTAAPVDYALVVKGDGYRLLAGGTELLAGPLRHYNPPDPGSNLLRAVYSFNNLVFLGDNTSDAGAVVRIKAVALTLAETPPPLPTPGLTPRAYLPGIMR
jgi:hypothetical protein